ncbi:hypothetical protein BayCH28_17450 [Mycolicibacterium sp. CH28]|uniref:DUF7065 domain-containing protein n=1 Tax=Mycolicibacterium sp. CH28 TaxID=2512237 RepID=UPI0010810F5B|nr:hypothetical protein [Mycolicibacterium sp. CH28]TGD86572.1 hypothetical protein BayCH28_17450 [Mycolicibacterium sp. CH28]
MVDIADERMHEPGSAPDWQESFYFNWFDSNSDAMGLARIGFRPNDKTCDALIYTMRGGAIERGYLRRGAPYEGIPDPHSLVAGDVEMRMVEPMSRWTLRLSGRDEVDLTWSGLNAPFDFHQEAPQPLPPGFADHHMEQSGRVAGRVKMRGVEYAVDGFGQRDKSWGVREWGRTEGWNWIPVLFGPDLAMNFTQLFYDGQAYAAGYIFHDGANHAVAQLAIDYDWASNRVPAGVRIEASDVDGWHISITGRSRGQGCLYHRGLMIQESPAEFEAIVDGKRRSGGSGLTEHAWRGGGLERLRAVPRFVATASRILR